MSVRYLLLLEESADDRRAIKPSNNRLGAGVFVGGGDWSGATRREGILGAPLPSATRRSGAPRVRSSKRRRHEHGDVRVDARGDQTYSRARRRTSSKRGTGRFGPLHGTADRRIYNPEQVTSRRFGPVWSPNTACPDASDSLSSTVLGGCCSAVRSLERTELSPGTLTSSVIPWRHAASAG